VTTTIKLKSPQQLGPAVRRLSKSMDRSVVKALRNTARWGAAEALRVSASTSPRPRATGTFERSFVVTKLVDGALLSNSAKHARFVEVGRAPGKQPPVQAIVDWMIARKIGQGGEAQIRATARRIARKIGRRGTRGRYVMKRTIPGMRKRLALEMMLEMRKAFERAGSR
jgi:hypothetical protein